MHPSLTEEAQAEKRREYDRVPAYERQRISKHTPATKTARQMKQRQARRNQRKAGNRQRNQQRNKR